jgi:hypothetical protein
MIDTHTPNRCTKIPRPRGVIDMRDDFVFIDIARFCTVYDAHRVRI